MTFLFEKRAVPDPLRPTGFGHGGNWTGETVTEDSALETVALNCISFLADSVASLPLQSMREAGDRQVRIPKPSWLTTPCPTVTEYELKHMIVTTLGLHGNFYAFVDINGGLPRSLVPLHPLNVNVNIVNGKRDYTVAGTHIPAENILHLRWFTPPQAAKGISPIHAQRTTLGLSLAMDRHLAQWYGEGATPSSVLEADAEMTPEAAKVLQATWETQHRRRRRPAVLSGGLKWKPIQTSAADMQLIATREQVMQNIAAIFRVPAHMAGIKGTSQTYQNVGQESLGFTRFTLLPWLTRIEQFLSDLMRTSDFVRFDTSAFLRADTTDRYRAHQVGISSGFLTPNEARAVEGLEPYEGGDEFVMALPGAPMAGPGLDPPPVGVDAVPPV